MEKKLPEGWEIKQFLECIEKEASSNKLKIPKSEFQNKGEYPIIDQGTEYIAGYTDNPLKVYKGELPVIIFGDHTRIFKFVDFPFSLGADGTKVLVPKKDLLHPKYFYFFLHRLKIESHGYSRHYKFLKEKQIVIPPLQTQKKIVSILEKAEETKRLRMQADELTNQLLQSVFLEMFGDPVKNQKGWEKSKIREITVHHKQGFYTNSDYVDEGIKLIRITDITEFGKLFYDNMPFLRLDTKTIEQFKVQIGDFLFARSGVSIGRCAIVEKDIPCVFGSYIIRFRFDLNKINNKVFLFLMKLPQLQAELKKYGHGSANPNINAENIKNIEVIVPPLPLQQKFAQIVEKVEAMRQNQKQSQQEIDNLFNALMQKAFKGELTP